MPYSGFVFTISEPKRRAIDHKGPLEGVIATSHERIARLYALQCFARCSARMSQFLQLASVYNKKKC